REAHPLRVGSLDEIDDARQRVERGGEVAVPTDRPLVEGLVVERPADQRLETRRPVAAPGGADDGAPPLEVELVSVLEIDLVDRLVDRPLGVEDQPVEVEDDRVERHQEALPTTRATTASTTPSMVCGSATASTVRPSRRATSAVTGPMQTTARGGGSRPTPAAYPVTVEPEVNVTTSACRAWAAR